MFEDKIDLEGFYGMQSASSLAVLIQILASNGKISTTHDLQDRFSDGIHDLILVVDELQMLGFLDVTATEVNCIATAKLEISSRGHALLSLYALELIDYYQPYFKD